MMASRPAGCISRAMKIVTANIDGCSVIRTFGVARRNWYLRIGIQNHYDKIACEGEEKEEVWTLC